MPQSPPEKLPAALWPKPRDSSIHAKLEVDAEPLEAVLAAVREAGHRLTVTAVASRAIGEVLAEHPRMNRAVRGGRLQDRDAFDVWVTMSDDEGRLAGRRLGGMHERDLLDVQEQINTHGREHKEGRSTGSRAVQTLLRWTPLWMLRGVARFLEFWVHTLRLPLGMLGVGREGFGNVHITNVGGFGARYVNAPIPPVMGQSILLAIGELHDAPVVDGDEVRPGRVLPVSVTADHRIVVGIEAAKWATRFQELLEDPDWLVDQLPGEVADEVRKDVEKQLA